MNSLSDCFLSFPSVPSLMTPQCLHDHWLSIPNPALKICHPFTIMSQLEGTSEATWSNLLFNAKVSSTVFWTDGIQLVLCASLVTITHYCTRQLISLLDDGIETSFQGSRVLNYTGLEPYHLWSHGSAHPDYLGAQASYWTCLCLISLLIQKGGAMISDSLYYED